MESWIFLGIILAIALIAKNSSLVIAAGVVLLLKAIPFSGKLMTLIEGKGINWGVTIISVAILIPIATGKIGFADLISVFKSPAGLIALACGVLVAVLSRQGVSLLAATPQVTVALLFGTILGVVLLNGVAAGPVIASGITYCIISILHIGIN
ncbi:MAG: DUF441 domain-containing protein [Liquorilactobacillus nagelii]|jgi:uncharacterized membrane protein (DUF441 family)|uniref:UPF0756 membrane protein BSQ50_06320 n=1 Tax=Liquorilactobacillus nagelii TaxID=82688 RepID=A0A3Q8CC94_9LACO|nr:DUF441 domain-containing protein [Liquorilactobacillus nagelii]AUJ32201.1 hypothetical protein BSQ50_06320 [Liquorilactobacillus nagelii]KRL40888.1 hypothetical protein FD45_GL001538 [Liquorilactobacillus nagelii DSM 13675]MCC7615374.1 DUF441 domain-containing protein [Liquorilactobacillus nagelii]MCI1632472.1 DUF441 domain-containing protein [Liquorilactobacillus nagelii]MCI1700202.1 DUF441 domain-containing protein [Liquorilactobacillus nagelii]